jgi:hypothetical protein
VKKINDSLTTKVEEPRTVNHTEPNLKDKGVIAIADTILYDVVVRNPNPNDEWTKECLRYVNNKALVDGLFEAVFKGKLMAYNYKTDVPLTIDEVRKIDSENKRSLIGKLQCTEQWYWDTKNYKLYKKVVSIIIGYEVFDAEGAVRGYKAGFKVYLNDETKNKDTYLP